MVKHIETVQEFETLISQGKVLVDFFATWCGPCKMLSPVIEEMDEKKLAGDLLILKVDVDHFPTLAGKYGIMSIPALYIFQDGKVIKTSLGYMNEGQLLSFLK